MGKRSVVLDDEDIPNLTAEELGAEISRCKMRRDLAGTAVGRKSFEKRIRWLEKIRRRREGEESL
jgi:hypothetical protein